MASERFLRTVEEGLRTLAEHCPRLVRACYLPGLLQSPATLRKYTIEALRRAPWSVLELFPRSLLLACIEDAQLRPSRLTALEFLLS